MQDPEELSPLEQGQADWPESPTPGQQVLPKQP
jgi:hypothetical protein